MTPQAKLVGHSLLCFHNLANGEVALDEVEAFYLDLRSFERIQALEDALVDEAFGDGLVFGTVTNRTQAETLVVPIRQARERDLLRVRAMAMGPVWKTIWSQDGQPYELD